MEVSKLKEQIKEITIDGMIDKYRVEFRDGTMIINEKIPVKDFIYLKKNIRKFRKVDNIIVDAEYNATKGSNIRGLL